MGIILHILLTAAALWATTRLVPGIRVEGDLQTLLWVALVFGVVNAVVKPVVKLLALPAVVLTLGLFLVVINGAMLLLTATLVPSLVVEGWQAALYGGLVVSAVSWVLHLVFGR